MPGWTFKSAVLEPIKLGTAPGIGFMITLRSPKGVLHKHAIALMPGDDAEQVGKTLQALGSWAKSKAATRVEYLDDKS